MRRGDRTCRQLRARVLDAGSIFWRCGSAANLLFDRASRNDGRRSVRVERVARAWMHAAPPARQRVALQATWLTSSKRPTTGQALWAQRPARWHQPTGRAGAPPGLMYSSLTEIASEKISFITVVFVLSSRFWDISWFLFMISISRENQLQLLDKIVVSSLNYSIITNNDEK